MTIQLRLLPSARLVGRLVPQTAFTAKVSPRLAATIVAGDGIEVDYSGGVYTISATGGQTFTLSIPISGKPSNAENIECYLFVDAVTFPASFTGSRANAGTAATAQTVFSILLNGVQAGTVTFAAAATTGTFVLASALDVVAGDSIDLLCPATADATLADIKITLRASLT